MMSSLRFGLVAFMVLIMIGDAAPESIANGKPTSQSTISWGGVSELAVDGNTDGYWLGYSCAHTNGNDSWWTVDLEWLYEITSVKIYNRVDCCGEWLHNFDIMVGNNASNPAAMELCHHQQSAVGAMLEINCTNPIQGRHVLIRLLSGKQLTLCEVEVFGDAVPESIANGKPTFQSTLGTCAVSDRAVDGNTDSYYRASSCLHTDLWWAVDLQAVYEVRSINIYNRQDCCGERLQNFDIMVGNIADNPMELCHHQQFPVENMLAINCTNPIHGRHVLIRRLNGTVLALCEVEVFVVP